MKIKAERVPKLRASQQRALDRVRKAGSVLLTQANTPQEWSRYNALAENGYLTCYLGAEDGSMVFMLRPAFKGREP